MGKKLGWIAIALVMAMNAGCCRLCDRWCHGGPSHYHGPAPAYGGVAQCPPGCCPAPVQCCPTSYSSPGGAVPVPAAGPRTSWQGDCR